MSPTMQQYYHAFGDSVSFDITYKVVNASADITDLSGNTFEKKW